MKTYEEFKRRFEEEMTSTASVPGAGDDNQTVIVRKKYAHEEAPFKVPFYPVLPLLFIAVIGWFIFENALADKAECYAGLAVIPVGVVVYYAFKRRRAR